MITSRFSTGGCTVRSTKESDGQLLTLRYVCVILLNYPHLPQNPTVTGILTLSDTVGTVPTMAVDGHEPEASSTSQ